MWWTLVSELLVAALVAWVTYLAATRPLSPHDEHPSAGGRALRVVAAVVIAVGLGVLFPFFWEFVLFIALGMVVGLLTATTRRVRESSRVVGVVPNAGTYVLSEIAVGVVGAAAIWLSVFTARYAGGSLRDIRRGYDEIHASSPLDQITQRWGVLADGTVYRFWFVCMADLAVLLSFAVLALGVRNLRLWATCDRAVQEDPTGARAFTRVTRFEKRGPRTLVVCVAITIAAAVLASGIVVDIVVGGRV